MGSGTLLVSSRSFLHPDLCWPADQSEDRNHFGTFSHWVCLFQFCGHGGPQRFSLLPALFVIGVAYGFKVGVFLQRCRWPWAASLILFILQALLINASVQTFPFFQFTLGLTGTFGLIAWAQAMHSSFVAKLLQRTGAASLGIFLLHSYVQGVTREIMKRIFPSFHDFSVIVQITAAIIIPILLYEWLMTGPGRYLFTLRRPRSVVSQDRSDGQQT